MSTPKITVIVLASQEKWLNTCIASILRQRFENFELIIGSNSNCQGIETIVSRWKDPRARHIRTIGKPNTTLNKIQLLSLATGRFVKFISGTDFLYENSLEELLKTIDATGAPLVFHNWRYADSDGLILDSSNSVPPGYTEISLELLTRYMVSRRDNIIGGGENLLFDREKASVLPTCFGVDGLNLSYLGDLALCIHLAATGFIAGVGVFGSAKRVTNPNFKNFNEEACLGELLEWEVLQRWCLDKGHIQIDEASQMARPHAGASSSPFATLPAHPPFLTDTFRESVNELFATESHP
jgi:hypothetical protein